MPTPGQNLFGILIEGVVVDFLIVAGLAGQKMAVMRLIDLEREDEAQLHSGVDNNIWEEVDIGELFVDTSNLVMTVNQNNEGDKNAVNDTRVPHAYELITDCMWVSAFLIFVAGNVFEMVALSFTTQTNVALLSNFTLIWNSLLSTVIFKEDFHFYPVYREWSFKVFYRWDASHCFILLIGSVLAVSAAPAEPSTEPDATEMLKRLFEIPFSICALIMILMMFFAGLFLVKNWRNHKTGNLNAAMIAGLCAFFATFTLTLSKISTTLISLTLGGNNQYNDPEALLLTALWVTCLVSELSLLNIALGSFEQGVVIPIFEILGTVTSVAAGMLYNKTYHDFTPMSFIVFLLGVFLMLWGVWLVAHREVHSQQELAEKFHNNLTNVDTLLRVTSLSRSPTSARHLRFHHSSADELEQDIYIPTAIGNAQYTAPILTRKSQSQGEEGYEYRNPFMRVDSDLGYHVS